MMLRVNKVWLLAILTLMFLTGHAAAHGAAMATYHQDFGKLDHIPKSWAIQGNVHLSRSGGYNGHVCLTLTGTQARHFQPTSVILNSFPVKPGAWRIVAAMKSALVSPDTSYNGQLSLQVLGSGGTILRTIDVGYRAGQSPWHLFAKLVDIPQRAVAARFCAQLNKTWGSFSIAALRAAYVPMNPSAVRAVSAIEFADKAPGSLFYPKQKVCFTITVKTSRPLARSSRRVVCLLTDYWGAAFFHPVNVKLTADAHTRTIEMGDGFERVQPDVGPQTYTGTLRFAAAALQEGKYYRIHASVPEPGVVAPCQTHWAFAILPHAVTNIYPPFAIPFTQRNWDGRIPEDIILSHRLGIRISDLWSGWKPTPPYKSWASDIRLCKKFHMGTLLSVPNREAKDGNDPQWTDTALRVGARRFINKYKNYGVPFAVSLGNEPGPTNQSAARNMIAGYKAVYEGIKAADSKIIVIGTSCGTSDIFFKNGFQPYQDAYDYHDYGNSNDVPATFKIYHQFFKQYPNTAKPIWSTETGLNSAGLTRSRIARTMVRKFALFFANGGTNISWFDLLYPNGGGMHMRGASFNVFHIRYNNYCPKMTAVCYYNLINGICIKKCIASKIYPGHIHDVLFKDVKNHCLQIIWKTGTRQAIFIPLPGVGAIKAIYIDGSSSQLNAYGHGITLNIAPFPVMLEYTSAAMTLPATLGAPAIALASKLASIVKGGSVPITLDLHGVPPGDIQITPPPFWHVALAQAPNTWILSAPQHTTARQARIIVSMTSGAAALYFGIPITGQLTATLLPSPKTGPTTAGLKLLIRNNGIAPQTYLWHISVQRQYPMVDGGFKFIHHVSVAAYFGAINSGSISVPPGRQKHITISLSGLQPQSIYRVAATIRESSGQTVIVQRMMSGFVGVPYISHPIPLNGRLDATVWAKSPVQHINKANQFFAFNTARRWQGPNDLSGTLRFLWSTKYLYVGVKVTDRLFCNTADGVNIWQGDGLQFLVDPVRALAKKIGYYDYSMAVGTQGPQAWCNSSANSTAPIGNAKSIIVTTHRLNKTNGNITYVLAIPWSRLAPFKPVVDADLGLSMILNDANTHGRNCYMGWYSGVSSKALLHVGDLILEK